jgi:hypothetical protein
MTEPTITQTSEGYPIEVGRWEKRTVKVGREWRVEVDGVHVGDVRYALITRERRTPGKRYVNARWQSPGWQYRGAGGHYGHWFEGYTKKECVERLVRDARA